MQTPSQKVSKAVALDGFKLLNLDVSGVLVAGVEGRNALNGLGVNVVDSEESSADESVVSFVRVVPYLYFEDCAFVISAECGARNREWSEIWVQIVFYVLTLLGQDPTIFWDGASIGCQIVVGWSEEPQEWVRFREPFNILDATRSQINVEVLAIDSSRIAFDNQLTCGVGGAKRLHERSLKSHFSG